jgi:hypothetical protein
LADFRGFAVAISLRFPGFLGKAPTAIRAIPAILADFRRFAVAIPSLFLAIPRLTAEE